MVDRDARIAHVKRTRAYGVQTMKPSAVSSESDGKVAGCREETGSHRRVRGGAEASGLVLGRPCASACGGCVRGVGVGREGMREEGCAKRRARGGRA